MHLPFPDVAVELSGGEGDDKIFSGTGAATLSGGAGKDLLDARLALSGSTLLGGEGADKIYGSVFDDVSERWSRRR